MNAAVMETEVQEGLAPAEVATTVPTAAPAAAPAPAIARPRAFTALPVGQSRQSSALARLQHFGNRALAETSYRLQRVGAATLAGCVAVVIAISVFLTSNLPQRAVVTALQNDLARPTPAGNGAAGAGPTGAVLASLPPRTEAASVVGKILEEAQAAGVELPRGQYEYIPARDGVAARYQMTFPVHASYPKIREFMDRTLLALPAVAIEGLRIERKNVGDDSVDAELKLAAFVRSDP